MLIYVFALNGVFDIGLASLLDVIGTANELGQREQSSLQLDMRLVGVRQEVHTAQGLSVPVTRVTALPRPDVVLLPAHERNS